MNGLGGLVTGVTTAVVLVAKFLEGAWITLLFIPMTIVFFSAVRRHYHQVKVLTTCRDPVDAAALSQHPIAIIAIDRWSSIVRQGIEFAARLSPEVIAVHVEPGEHYALPRDDWQHYVEAPFREAGMALPQLHVLPSPYRFVIIPFVQFVLEVSKKNQKRNIIVVIPELVEDKWYEYFLHNQRGLGGSHPRCPATRSILNASETPELPRSGRMHMSRTSFFLLALSLLANSAFAVSSIEVLYVAENQAGETSLLTYNVDPVTAVATQVGQTISVGAASVDPITVVDQHFVYIWNSTNVWTYVTDANGAPNAKPEQHLTFSFPHPVTSFAADPNGKFAYAGVSWWDTQSETNNATVYLYTISQSTGELTNLEEVVAQYGPDPYIGLTGFSFDRSSTKLLASFFNNGPYTCEWGYDYYPVDQGSGHLGSLQNIVEGGSCSGPSAVAVSDSVAGGAGGPCGQGCGGVGVTQLSSGKVINCTSSMLLFCGDAVAFDGLYFDPVGRSLFFADTNTHQTYIGNLNFNDATITQSDSSIPGNPKLFFSPDSTLVYALYGRNIEIYALQSKTGSLTANTSAAVQGKVNIATAILANRIDP